MRIFIYFFYLIFYHDIFKCWKNFFLIVINFSIFFLVIFFKPLRKVTIISSVFLFLFITFTSFVQIGKSDPSSRLIIKTFNEIQTKYDINKNYKITKRDKNFSKKEKKIIKRFFLFFSTEHTGHYILAYHLFKLSPIFGNGPEGFKSYCRSVNYDSDIGMCSTHPHNTMMQILAETGFLGFIFYLIGFFFIFLKIFQFRKI